MVRKKTVTDPSTQLYEALHEILRLTEDPIMACKIIRNERSYLQLSDRDSLYELPEDIAEKILADQLYKLRLQYVTGTRSSLLCLGEVIFVKIPNRLKPKQLPTIQAVES